MLLQPCAHCMVETQRPKFVAHLRDAALEVVGAEYESGLERAKTEQAERLCAASSRGSASWRAPVHRDPASVPVAHAFFESAP